MRVRVWVRAIGDLLHLLLRRHRRLHPPCHPRLLLLAILPWTIRARQWRRARTLSRAHVGRHALVALHLDPVVTRRHRPALRRERSSSRRRPARCDAPQLQQYSKYVLVVRFFPSLSLSNYLPPPDWNPLDDQDRYNARGREREREAYERDRAEPSFHRSPSAPSSCSPCNTRRTSCCWMFVPSGARSSAQSRSSCQPRLSRQLSARLSNASPTHVRSRRSRQGQAQQRRATAPCSPRSP